MTESPSNQAGERLLEDSQRLRETMLRTQVAARGVNDDRVLDAMRRIPRELFVPAEQREQAYEDRALPIGPGQTISQPFMVAYMTYQLEPTADCKVLEIGTGSGYQAAILARLAREVHTIEYDEKLSELARRRLARMGLNHAHFHVGDGSAGCPSCAPFDRIIVTAGCPRVPAVLVDQMNLGGILIVPVGDSDSQTLLRIRKRESGTVESPLISCRFVKMLGEYGWKS